MIDPFVLFGLTIEADLPALKKRYHELALISHPDRGGTAEQMRAVQTAYEYCREQLEHRLDQSYEEFCEARDTEFPPMNDITADVLQLPKFEWDASLPVWSTFDEPGYGESMDDRADEREDCPEKTEVTFELAAWTGEPLPLLPNAVTSARTYVCAETGERQLFVPDDKSVRSENLNGYDYALAHSTREDVREETGECTGGDTCRASDYDPLDANQSHVEGATSCNIHSL